MAISARDLAAALNGAGLGAVITSGKIKSALEKSGNFFASPTPGAVNFFRYAAWIFDNLASRAPAAAEKYSVRALADATGLTERHVRRLAAAGSFSIPGIGDFIANRAGRGFEIRARDGGAARMSDFAALKHRKLALEVELLEQKRDDRRVEIEQEYKAAVVALVRGAMVELREELKACKLDKDQTARLRNAVDSCLKRLSAL